MSSLFLLIHNTFYNNQRMQQQIQVEKNEEISSRQLDHRIPQQDSRGFEIINDDQQIIQEDINQNYEQDFDSISNDSHHHQQEHQNQIMEDFDEIEEIITDVQQPKCKEVQKSQSDLQFQPASKTDCEQLSAQCRKMQLQITLLTKQIQENTSNLTKMERDPLQELQNTISQNNQILQALQLEQVNFFQSKIGKDSFCIQHLHSPQDFEEKLIEEIDKLKQLINMSYLEVCRIKRQTKKNQEILPLEETNQEQFYLKYKRLKKEVEDKRQKTELQQQKENEFESKLLKLKQKIKEIDQSLNNFNDSKRSEGQRNFIAKYQDLNKRKEVQSKKNTLIQHQAQNNCQIISRNILELRKQNIQIQQKITSLSRKNSGLQEDSKRLMQKYDQAKENRKNKQKFIEPCNQSNESGNYSPSNFKIISQRTNRRKYYSQTKNPFITNLLNDDSAAKHIQTDILNFREEGMPRPNKSINTSPPIILKQNESILKTQLNQSSTSNTLKQFKLKLPTHTPQKSIKNLNISLEIYKGTPTRSKNKTDMSKLSITQRLEHIELLERQDKIYSHKLYEMKKKQDELILLNKRQISQSFTQAKDFSSVNSLPFYQKQLTNQTKKEKSLNLTFDAKIDANLSCVNPKPSKELLNLRADSSQSNREADAQLSQKINEASDESLHLTDRLHHKFFKKRIINRQKKISEQYMKVLQQRGRKILQLDNESQN